MALTGLIGITNRAFRLLAAFTTGFMVQGGVSLHQVARYINQGLPGQLAGLTAGTYASQQGILMQCGSSCNILAKTC